MTFDSLSQILGGTNVIGSIFKALEDVNKMGHKDGLPEETNKSFFLHKSVGNSVGN